VLLLAESASFEWSELLLDSCGCSSLLLALVIVLESLSSSELSSFEWLLLLLACFFELILFGNNVGDATE